MKRLIFLFAIFLLLIPSAISVSTDLRTSYSPKETMIGEISGGILAPIQRSQVRVVKDGHLDVGVQYDVKRLGSKQFIWIIAPANAGQYRLILEDVVALVDGVPEVIDFTHDFTVQGSLIQYTISPGFILTDDDFEILATVYSGSQTVSTDFPEQREINLYTGVNHIDFSIEEVLGVQQIMINLGTYQFPARILGAEYLCGDGRIDSREVCDGLNLDGNSCTTIPGSFASGTLKCSSGCLAFDTSLCKLPEEPEEPEEEPECGSDNLNLCLNGPNCTGAGGYWYNETCNRYEPGAVCDSQHVGLCGTFGTCFDAGGYWYNETCNDEPKPICSSEHLDLCGTFGTCFDAGGYWYNETCNDGEEVPEAVCGDDIIGPGEECDGQNLSGSNCSTIGFDGGNLTCNPAGSGNGTECMFNVSECFVIPPKGPPSFVIDPASITSVVFVRRDLPVYNFVVKNNGESELNGLRLDFNPSKFSIEPNRNISIGANQSRTFNLTIKEFWRGRPFKGVVIAQYEDIYEYMLVDISFTEEEGDAITAYSKNSTSSGPSYYCSELSGYSCSADETCEGEIVSTIDFNQCCVGSCNGSGGGSSGNSWIGWLIAGIVIVVGAIIFLKFRKTGKNGGKNPLQARLAKQKGLP
ncbi:MAG: hypothetical protein ABH864_04140 [archaeon]